MEALIETALRRVYSEAQDSDLVERLIEWLGEDEQFVPVKLSEVNSKKKSAGGSQDPYNSMYLMY